MKGSKFFRKRRGFSGLTAAIVLIAFVIIAAAFAYMYVNMGNIAVSGSKKAISTGLKETSSPVIVDGSIVARTTENRTIQFIIIPLKAAGEDKVPMWPNETTVTFIQDGKSYPNIYTGFNYTYDPKQKDTDTVISDVLGSTPNTPSSAPKAMLIVENSNGDFNLDSSEKGYLLIDIGPTMLSARTPVTIEIRVENGAPLTVSFVVPSNLDADAYVTIHA